MTLPTRTFANTILAEHRAAMRDAASAVQHARKCGQLLLEAREDCGGNWLEWLAANCSEIAERTAQKYMQIARHPELEAKSIGEALLKLASPRQPNNPPGRAGRQVIEPEQKSSDPPQDSPRAATAKDRPEASPSERGSELGSAPSSKAPLDLPKAEQLAAARAAPEISRSAPPAKPDEEWEPDADEVAQMRKEDEEYHASIAKVMAADDKLAAAHAEIKRQAAEIATLKLSRNGFQNQCADLTRRVKSLQRKLDKLEKRAA